MRSTHNLEPADPCSGLRTGLTIVDIVNPGRGWLGLAWAAELLLALSMLRHKGWMQI